MEHQDQPLVDILQEEVVVDTIQEIQLVLEDLAVVAQVQLLVLEHQEQLTQVVEVEEQELGQQIIQHLMEQVDQAVQESLS
jgi:hypothetical protein